MAFNKKFSKDFLNLKRKQRSLEELINIQELIKEKKLNNKITENVKDILGELAGRYNVAIYQVHQQINK